MTTTATMHQSAALKLPPARFLPPYVKSHESRPLRDQFPATEAAVGLNILFAGPGGDFGGQFRSRWLLIPANRFQVVANVLLIKRLLAHALLVLIGRPEPGGVRSENFVGQ